MHGIPAEVAQEIGVLFHHNNGYTGASQQKAKHHAGGSSAGDTAGSFDRGDSHLFADSTGSAPAARFPRAKRFFLYACLSGVVTVSPSSSSVTLIWHESRELGRTS